MKKNNCGLEKHLHDDLVNEVIGRLRLDKNESVMPFISYGLYGCFGELDILRVRDGVPFAVYEIKLHNHYDANRKAKCQLRKAHEYFGHSVYCVYVSKNKRNKLVAELVFKPKEV